MSEGIEKRIASLGHFFQGMQVASDNSGNSLIYVTVAFPDNWIIADEITQKYGVTVMRGDGYEYYFACELTNGFEPVFDAIEYNIKKMRQAQERAELFKTKANELQTLFGDESIPLEKLKSLTFSYSLVPPAVSDSFVQTVAAAESSPETKHQENLLERYNDYLEKEKEKEESGGKATGEPAPVQDDADNTPERKESQSKSGKKRR